MDVIRFPFTRDRSLRPVKSSPSYFTPVHEIIVDPRHYLPKDLFFPLIFPRVKLYNENNNSYDFPSNDNTRTK